MSHCDELAVHFDKLRREISNWTCLYFGVLLRFRLINLTMATLRYKLVHNNWIESDEAAGSAGPSRIVKPDVWLLNSVSPLIALALPD